MATSEKRAKISRACSFDEKDEYINNFALLVEDKKLYVNKAMLASVSPVFYAMFFSDFKESKAEEIAIKDVKYGDMRLLLKAVYQYIEIQGKDVPVLLELADRFDIQCIIRKCEQPLITSTVLSYKEKLIYAERFKFSELQESVLRGLTLANMKEFAEDSSEFGEGTLRKLLKHSIPFLNEAPPRRERERDPVYDWGAYHRNRRWGSPPRRDRNPYAPRRIEQPVRPVIDLDEEPIALPNREEVEVGEAHRFHEDNDLDHFLDVVYD